LDPAGTARTRLTLTVLIAYSKGHHWLVPGQFHNMSQQPSGPAWVQHHPVPPIQAQAHCLPHNLTPWSAPGERPLTTNSDIQRKQNQLRSPFLPPTTSHTQIFQGAFQICPEKGLCALRMTARDTAEVFRGFSAHNNNADPLSSCSTWKHHLI